MEFAHGDGVEAEVELIFLSEFESGFGEGVVAILYARMSFRQVRCVGPDFVGNHSILHIFFAGQSQMFFRGHLAEHRAAIPTDHRRADAAGDVAVAGRDVGGERPEDVERHFVTPLCPRLWA